MNWFKKPLLLVMLDVSGSVPPVIFDKIKKHLVEFTKKFRIHVLEFDLSVVNSYPYKGDFSLKDAFGGSSIRLAMMEARKKNPDMILCFTDGFLIESDLNIIKPECPVYWMMEEPEYKEWNPPFGVVVPMRGWNLES